RDQPLAALGVQLVDAVTQLGDGLGQVRAFDLHGLQPVAVFPCLVLGPQVDRPSASRSRSSPYSRLSAPAASGGRAMASSCSFWPSSSGDICAVSRTFCSA